MGSLPWFLLFVAAIVASYLVYRLIETEKGLKSEREATKRIAAEIDTYKSRALTAERTMQAEVAKAKAKIQEAEGAVTKIKARFKGVLDLDSEKQWVTQQISDLKEELKFKSTRSKALDKEIADRQRQVAILDEDLNLFSFGFYKPRYDFANSVTYQRKLESIRAEQKAMLKAGEAASCAIEWQVNGSKAEGKKQIDQTLKLMLRAFNGECDAAVAKVKYNNVKVMEQRIKKSFDTVNSLARVQQSTLSNKYLNLKLQELYLAHEYQERVQEEKEEQRRIREQMRDEEIARREIERALQDATRDETKFQEMLARATEDAAKATGEKQRALQERIDELSRRLDEAHASKERALSMAQQTKAGHVYVISNIGSFGEDVYKIGMTRRLDPLDRVRELGDASVPFLFDVHAVIYSEDAPALEGALHKKFNERRLNRINQRKEFFRVSLKEISHVVRQMHGEIEIVEMAEAKEYRETLALLAETANQPVSRAA